MRKAFLQLHTAVLLAGFTAILGKLILLNEAVLVWWRLLIAVLAFAFIVIQRNQIIPVVHNRLKLTGIGMLVGLHWLLFFGSVKYGSVSIALVCFSASGFFSALLNPWLQRQSVKLSDLVLGILGMAGIYIIYRFDSSQKIGIILGIAAAFLSALFSNLNKRMVDGTSGIMMSFYEMTGAFILLTLALPFYFYNQDLSFIPTVRDAFYLLILGLVCTVWAFVLQLQALRKISAVTLNLTYNLEPVYGILMAMFFLGEHEMLTTSFMAGLALILVSVIMQSWLSILSSKS